MILLRRIFAFAAPLGIAAAFLLGFRIQSIIIPVIVITTIALIAVLMFLVRMPILSKEMFYYSISPVLFFVSMIGFVLVLESAAIRNSVVVVGMIMILLYLENIFTYFYNRQAYQTHALTNISSYMNIITMFLVGVNAFGSLALIQAPLWILSIVLVLTVAALTTQTYWMHSVATRQNYLFSLLVTILMLELFWAFVFLPNNFYVNALLLSISYYVLWGILRAHLLKLLATRLLLRYIIVGAVTVIIVLLTSQWT